MAVPDEITQQARTIAQSKTIAAEYIQHPQRVLRRAVRSENFLGLRVSQEIQAKRASLAAALDEQVAPLREAQAAQKTFFKAAMDNPQWTFQMIFWSSVAAFLVSVGVVIAAFVAAWVGKSAAVTGVFGGVGLFSAIGTTLAASRESVRQANSDNAQIRLVMHAYSEKIRCIATTDKDGTQIWKAMKEAVDIIERVAEPTAATLAASTTQPAATGGGDGKAATAPAATAPAATAPAEAKPGV
jgi:ABC-type multidrug transport system fused ATPase/permease subunit